MAKKIKPALTREEAKKIVLENDRANVYSSEEYLACVKKVEEAYPVAFEGSEEMLNYFKEETELMKRVGRGLREMGY